MSRSRYYPERRRGPRFVKKPGRRHDESFAEYVEFCDTWDQDANVLDYRRSHIPEPGRRMTIRGRRKLQYLKCYFHWLGRCADDEINRRVFRAEVAIAR